MIKLRNIRNIWRTELVSVAKDWDELWLGVKGQSNWEIAEIL